MLSNFAYTPLSCRRIVCHPKVATRHRRKNISTSLSFQKIFLHHSPSKNISTPHQLCSHISIPLPFQNKNTSTVAVQVCCITNYTRPYHKKLAYWSFANTKKFIMSTNSQSVYVLPWDGSVFSSMSFLLLSLPSLSIMVTTWSLARSRTHLNAAFHDLVWSSSSASLTTRWRFVSDFTISQLHGVQRSLTSFFQIFRRFRIIFQTSLLQFLLRTSRRTRLKYILLQFFLTDV